MEDFGKFMTIVLAMIIKPVIRGFVVTKLWAWFIVPIFDMPELRIVEAIGMIFFVGYITSKPDKDENKEDFWDSFGKQMGFLFMMAGLALLGGWILQMFM